MRLLLSICHSERIGRNRAGYYDVAMGKQKNPYTGTYLHQEIAEKYETEFSSPDFYLENELFRLYEEALRKLPAEFRQAYEMNRSLQMTHKEIAEKLNVSPQTINYRIGQALKILRSELKDYLPLIMLFLFLQGHK